MRGVKTGGREKGTPNKSTSEVRDLARQHGPAAIQRAAELAGLVLDEGTGEPVGQAASEQARIAALGIILDRAYGKPSQPLTAEDEDGVRQIITHIELVARYPGDGHSDPEEQDAPHPRGPS